MVFGEILRELRHDKGVSQKELGDYVGFTQPSIRDWECRGIEPRFDILIKLADYFKVTVGQLLGTEYLDIPLTKKGKK